TVYGRLCMWFFPHKRSDHFTFIGRALHGPDDNEPMQQQQVIYYPVPVQSWNHPEYAGNPPLLPPPSWQHQLSVPNEPYGIPPSLKYQGSPSAPNWPYGITPSWKSPGSPSVPDSPYGIPPSHHQQKQQ
ncbi:hypothetical protein ABMA28_006676, partial [Loxostege sticticalis]